MRLVIEIPEAKYIALRKCNEAGMPMGVEAKAIIKGMMIPEDCGRLIDADKLRDTMWTYMLIKNKDHVAQYVMSVARAMVEIAPTIIEANK